MENFEKIEQLVNKAGCTYEDAKAALEANGWDMIDAIISLEREGKVKKESAAYTAKPAQEAEIVSEVVVDSTGSRTGNQSNGGYTGRSEKAFKEKKGLWSRFKSKGNCFSIIPSLNS